MKKILVIADFDGTISEEDFYKKIMNKYMPEKIETTYRNFKQEKMKDIDFLNDIFINMNLSEKEIEEEILDLKIDSYVKEVITYVRQMEGDFIILSAGCSYYIEKVIENLNIVAIPIFSNPGVYREKGMHIKPNKENEFYSERYGIDKELVVKYFRKQYEVIAYIGDSAPDYKASLHADIRFAKGELIELCEKNGVGHIPVSSFEEILNYLRGGKKKDILVKIIEERDR